MTSAIGLELVAVLEEHRAAVRRDATALGSLLDLAIPAAWPQFPEAFSEPPAHERHSPSYFFVDRNAGVLVGNGGFAGPMNGSGEVEIGYEVAPAHQNLGYATAAVEALLELAFSRPDVQYVIAHTLAEENASNAVLRKAGFAFVAELPNAEVGAVWKWVKPRPADRSAAGSSGR